MPPPTITTSAVTFPIAPSPATRRIHDRVAWTGGCRSWHAARNTALHGESVVIGRRLWAIAEGYIPPESHGPGPEMESHETACLLNAGDREAHVRITAYFADREPSGPFEVLVPARRTLHLRFNSLPIPKGTDYSTVIESDVPIVVQHTRLDSRQAEEALLSTIAYSQ